MIHVTHWHWCLWWFWNLAPIRFQFI